MAWSFNILGASSVTTATTSLTFNVVDSSGAAVAGMTVRVNGTGLTYNATTGEVGTLAHDDGSGNIIPNTAQITSIELLSGGVAVQTLAVGTSHQATIADDLSIFMSHALTFQSQMTAWGASADHFGVGVDVGASVIDPSSGQPYGSDTVQDIAVYDSSNTIVNYLRIVGSSNSANKPGMNEYVQTVELLKADGTSYSTPKIADYTGPEYSAAGSEMQVSQIAYGGHGDWASVFGVLATGDDTLAVNSASSYVVDAGLGNDTIAGSSGTDTIDFKYATGAVTVDFTHKDASNNSDPIASFTDPVLGTKFTQHLSGIENITGSLYADKITADGGANYLFGGYDSEADTLTGGAGDDTYKIIDHNDLISEAAGSTGGTDLVESYVSFDATTLTGIENVTLYGTAADVKGNSLANVLTGTSSANDLDGASGADTMIGGFGDDTYHVDNSNDVVTETSGLGSGIDTVITTTSFALTYGGQVEILKTASDTGGTDLDLTGDSVANTITGNSGKNTLDGGNSGSDGQIDTLNGLLGNDTYVLGDGSDIVVDTGGSDTITSTITRTLADYAGADAAHAIENLTLTGTADVNATGNQYDNKLTGNSGANILTGGIGNDTFTGGAGADTFVWEANGKDVVTDFTIGTDVIDVAGLGISEFATIQALAVATGTSVTVLNRFYGNATHTLTLGVANASLSSSDFAFSTSTSDDNLTGTAYADDMFGGKGNDTISGGAGSDRLFGEAGNDYIDGGTGNDFMYGGAGNDTFVVDSTLDKIFDASGSDTIKTSVNYTLNTTALAGVENLTATGTGNLALVGNATVNTITGNSGNNVLDGKAGADVLNGGGGNDTYYVDNAGDTITDSAGTDTVAAAVSYTLAAGVAVEKLMTYANTFTVVNGANVLTQINMNLTGNEFSQAVIGNGKVNVINGGAGNDTLTGGAGKDVFVFNTALNATTNKDTITDFSPADDTIKLENTGAGLFNGLGTGNLAATRFYIGTAAHDADDRIIYNKTTGVLSYDADGNGAGAAVAFAVIANKTALTNLDFVVI